MENIQKLSGHRISKTTEIYIAVTRQQWIQLSVLEENLKLNEEKKLQ